MKVTISGEFELGIEANNFMDFLLVAQVERDLWMSYNKKTPESLLGGEMHIRWRWYAELIELSSIPRDAPMGQCLEFLEKILDQVPVVKFDSVFSGLFKRDDLSQVEIDDMNQLKIRLSLEGDRKSRIPIIMNCIYVTINTFPCQFALIVENNKIVPSTFRSIVSIFSEMNDMSEASKINILGAISELENFFDSSCRRMEEFGDQNSSVNENVLNKIIESSANVDIYLEKIDGNFRDFRNNISEIANSSRIYIESRFKDLESSVQERLAFDDVHELWGDADEKYHKSSMRKFLASGAFALIGVIIVLLSFKYSLNYRDFFISGAEDKQLKIMFPAICSGLVSIVCVWSLRIIIRLAVADHHRSVDAANRVRVHSTFVRLIADGLATVDDRASMLAYILSPLRDGSGDDGMPTIGPMAAVIKSVSDTKG